MPTPLPRARLWQGRNVGNDKVAQNGGWGERWGAAEGCEALTYPKPWPRPAMLAVDVASVRREVSVWQAKSTAGAAAGSPARPYVLCTAPIILPERGSSSACVGLSRGGVGYCYTAAFTAVTAL
ncbi:hypothetical protein SKAU_G00303880 [Synaphobranchus kaupii]|uniref:Uncharacterized protein n=1 Tax=Synaphobranchus kaupii TaxID=118154 RepID=A0A9Q1ILE8_SYNKA|nr:hypothetical protein SKAU_G00303880 [Synaphobranchus kaupii]